MTNPVPITTYDTQIVKRAWAGGSNSARAAPAPAATIGPIMGSSMAPLVVDSMTSLLVNCTMGNPTPMAKLKIVAAIHMAHKIA